MKEFFNLLVSTWWGIALICVVAVAVWILISALFYRLFFKRFYDIVLSLFAFILLSPVILLLIVLGAIKMKGNPFFTQLRPGKIDKRTGEAKIFRLIKFRTMTCERDENGNLLPDEKRLTRYGRILRSTSLDELPELINIFIGNMSIVGPRPLLVEYLPRYNEEQKRRHEVRPGLTGYAQVNGRNGISWVERFKLDVHYVDNISLFADIAILFKTVWSVIKREGISSADSATMEVFMGETENKEE